MVTITPEAVAMIERVVEDSDLDWFVKIRWRKGEADNFRGVDGAAIWKVEPNREWVAELGAQARHEAHDRVGEALCGRVRVFVWNFFAPHPFPGGEIFLENDQLKVRANAI